MGRDGSQPMNEVIEWEFAGGGTLRVFADRNRAGKSSVTLIVDDIDAQVAAARSAGIHVPAPHRTPTVDTAIFRAPNGNQLVFAQPE